MIEWCKVLCEESETVPEAVVTSRCGSWRDPPAGASSPGPARHFQWHGRLVGQAEIMRADQAASCQPVRV